MSKPERAWKDSEYKGGTFLRKVDKGLQRVGIDRNSAFMRKCHAMEHDRRAKIAEKQGDKQRAEAERRRADYNRNGQSSQNK